MHDDLEKKLPGYNPDTALTPTEEAATANWQGASDSSFTDASRPSRENIPRMEGAARIRGLHRMTGKTQVRMNPEGKREYLMHRAMSPEEAKTSLGPTHVTHDRKSSWTPVAGAPEGEMYSLINHFQKEYGGPIASAWIPEDKIHAMLPMWGAMHPHAVENDQWTRENTDFDGNAKTRGPGYQNKHWEVVVDPHQSQLASPDEQKQAFADDHEQLDTRINQRQESRIPALSQTGRLSTGRPSAPGDLDPTVYHNQNLAKNKPTPRFPGLGLPDDRRETPIVEGRGLVTKERAFKRLGAEANSHSVDIQEDIRNKPFKPSAGIASGTSGTHTGYAVSNRVRQRSGMFEANLPNLDEKADLATQQHENWHQMMLRVQEKHGRDKRKALARDMVLNGANATHWQHGSELEQLGQMMHPRAGGPRRDHEEVVATLFNYLHSPNYRAEYHRRANNDTPERINLADKRLKGAYRSIINYANQVTPEHINSLSTEGLPDDFARKSEELSKATRPQDLASIGKATTPDGPKVVDHTPHLSSHPPSIDHEVQAYRNEVVNSPKPVKKENIGRDSGGITKKVVYKVGDQKYMVKPYHERIITRVKKWMDHPVQGWAEMANQALYHAGGIGHLHQKVHVTEHDFGNGQKEPALVVHMQPGHTDARSAYQGIKTGNPHAETAEEQGPHFDAKRIAMMDFLTNNLDRHGGNLLRNDATQQPMGIDHSRSFQYQTPNDDEIKHAAPTKRPRDLNDKFGPYHHGSSVNSLSPLHPEIDPYKDPNSRYNAKMAAMNSYVPAFDWWGQNGANIRAEMGKQLEQIKDPKVKDHIQTNFDARADWLDERAKFGLENYGVDWHKDEVPIYKPGEKP